jgi:hypothetical protein
MFSVVTTTVSRCARQPRVLGAQRQCRSILRIPLCQVGRNLPNGVPIQRIRDDLRHSSFHRILARWLAAVDGFRNYLITAA